MHSNYHRISFCIALIPGFIGVLVMFGWYSHSATLIQLRPELVPMQFNTALAAFLAAALIQSFIFRKKDVQRGFWGLGLLLSGATFLQYPFSADFGLDTLFAEPYITVNSPQPGRMAINTSLCFSLFFLSAGIFIAGRQHLRWYVTAQALLGVVSGLSISSLFGYLTGLETAYGWGGLSQMAPHTALSLLCSTIALSFLMRGEYNNSDYTRAWNLSLTGGALFALLICILLAERASESKADYLVPGLFVLLVLLSGVLWYQIRSLGEQKQKLSAVERMRLGAFNAMLDGLVVIDGRGIIKQVNHAVSELFSYSEEELIGENVSCLMPSPHAKEHDSYLKRYQETGERHVVGQQRLLMGKKKDGSVFPMLLQVAEGGDASQPLYVGVIHDMTGVQLLENQLEAANADLVKYNQDLLQANEELESFAYVASHDLRSPLRGVRQLAEWIEEDLGEAAPEVRENLELMRGRIQRMENLLNDLLTYSRVGRKNSTQETFDAAECIDGVFNLVSAPEAFELECVCEVEQITVAKTAFEQVIRNLVDNAVKHRHGDSGKVCVRLNMEGNNYKVVVEDDGPGISEKYADTVFEMFQTLKSRDEVEGSGMGLSITRKLMQYYGGSIKLTPREELQKNREDVNCRFTITWPKASATVAQ